MSETVRTRFAPSPTGYLHIGGARTALFNFLLARRLNGKFVLRIEDTDQARNIEGAEEKLLEDMRWLGLAWDEGPRTGGPGEPYYQSQRIERYREHAERLLAEGRAYHAFESREELDALRDAAMREKRDFRYSRPERFPDAADVERARGEGRPVVIRFRMPDRDITVKDQILGDVTIAAADMDDFVIVKNDGWPTYHFAVVIDDEDMQITHVLRGQEHLINTPKHIALQEALGFAPPAYAHLPVILTMAGSKMSKREKDATVRKAADAAIESGAMDAESVFRLSGCPDENAYKRWKKKKIQLDSDGLERLAAALHVDLPEIDIHDFRRSGYLPEVILNFIALLGWSPGGDREKMSVSEMCECFDIARVGKTSAKFDREKLLSFNTDALNAATPERRLAAFRDYLANNEASPLAGLDDALLDRLMEMNRGFRTFRDIEMKCAGIFTADDAFAYDDSAVQKILLKNDAAGVAVLREMREPLEGIEPWTAAGVEGAIRSFGESRSLGLGKVAQPIRVAVTGSTISPPIFETLELLGRAATMARVDRAITYAASLDG